MNCLDEGLLIGCGFNGLLRQYFPKSTDLSLYSRDKLDEAARQLNERPRKTVGYATPAQLMDEVARQHLIEPAHRMEKPGRRDAKAAYERFAVHDAESHAWIAEQGGNELVAEALSRLHAHMHPFRLRFHSLVTEEAIQEHNKILKASIARYSEATAEAMRAHILRSRERMAPTFETLP